MKRLILFSIIIVSLPVLAQVKVPDEIVANALELLSENDVELNDQSQMFDELLDLYANPVQINGAKREEFEKLIFLSDFQIQQMLDFIQSYGPVYSKFQLQGLSGFSPSLIETMMNFVSLEVREEKGDTKNDINGQILLRDMFDLENAKGYAQADSGNSYYLGNKHHMYMKVKLNYGDRFSGGITLDKDPGEPIFTKKQPGFDFMSGHILYNGGNWLKTLVVGDYHANFGQGLAMWSGTNLGKGSDVLQVRKRGERIKKYSSANEFLFLRGVAGVIQIRNLELALFASSKKRDANILYDSVYHQSVAVSLPETGYHRTLSERETKNTLGQHVRGANLYYRWQDLALSMGGYFQYLDVDSIAVNDLYKKQNYLVSQSRNFWLSYNYGRYNYILFGEIASDQDGDIALLNGVQLRPAGNVSLSMLYRMFSKKYSSDWMNAFSESSAVTGESGFYCGVIVHPLSNLELSAYADVFKFSWLRYNIDKPSTGYEFSMRADLQVNTNFKVYLRYREKEKQENVSIDGSPSNSLGTYNLKRLRANAEFQPDENWRFRFRVEKSLYQKEGESASNGFLALTDVNYSTTNQFLSCWLRYVVFDTDDYDSRIYTYENDLLYNFYSPSFQEEGSRFYFLTALRINNHVRCWMKFAQTWYADKQEIGSGLQTIQGNTRTNLKIQLQIKF
jgi:hypothetical protein